VCIWAKLNSRSSRSLATRNEAEATSGLNSERNEKTKARAWESQPESSDGPGDDGHQTSPG
jgi:hypothetical protein